MTHLDTSDGRQPVFELEEAFRERLEQLGQQQYSAEARGRHDRARALRRELLEESRTVGAGAGRTVLALPGGVCTGVRERYVLKLAVPNDAQDGRDGRAQNRTEVETWASTYHPLLMPVVAADADGYWLVMPRGVAVTDTSPEIEAWLDRAREALAGVVWSGDIDAGNAVRLDGELRLCDYGLSPA
jgi:hypothetical protein